MSVRKKILSVNDISISFGGIKACNNVSFEINEGEIVSIIGPNGAGKTTVFNLLTGVYKTETGEINFNGIDISKNSPQEIVKKGIARTFQNIRLFKNMRVIENVLVGAHNQISYSLIDSIFRTKKYWNQEAEMLNKGLEVLKKLNLIEKKDVYTTSLPYGDQRKVEIARAIATGSKLILLDEPAAGMNPNETKELSDFVRQIRGLGITVLLIEHDMSFVMNLSDRVYVLNQGEMICSGTPEMIANDPVVIKAYLGGEI
ncbi:ABC transporter ATP-binding protein [Tuanshanicoccus lijuaniae]|uniref:ABC transporter ATP-binding protein n=1 Tax=Aerococcaceae bacterium zg-1292 TaxID=2774330 RepID=UPI001BD89A7E|nr:ABC transporter ATP-binding protein [Aerococcaceae bacterium zg-BR22]MBS4455512.1 ABC transporter ATP-binding protein [Aerococcaceae bacterium zg-A91]MBS4457131.1 ABC transporter ATP-binding protein [Aerococcaceae bacterium zg-BR33]